MLSWIEPKNVYNLRAKCSHSPWDELILATCTSNLNNDQINT